MVPRVPGCIQLPLRDPKIAEVTLSTIHADRPTNRALVWLALIILLAALLRFPDLSMAPLGGHGDVAWVGLNALDWVDRGVWPFYVRELYSPEFPVVYLDGLLLPFTGISYLPPRLVTASTGVLLIGLLFLATWWLLADQPRAFRERASLLAALSGAVSIQAMYLSRLGMESPPFLAALTLWAWLTAWAWWRGGWWRWTLAGAALGLCQYLYLPARVLPIVLLLWIAHSWWANRERWHIQCKDWLILAISAFVVALPALILFITVPGSFTGRADTGTAITGGWIWAYDTSAHGGPIGLVLQKLALTLLGIGIFNNGPYTIMNQPILGPLFAIGFLIALIVLPRNLRRIAYLWPIVAIPILLLPDVLSGAVPEIHALHQMGILPFVFILSGIGLAAGWEAIAPRLSSPAVRRVAGIAAIVLAVAPGAAGTYHYLHNVIPAQYADPETGWRAEQIDVDVSNYILAGSQRAYLLSYAEYSRSNFAWLLSDKFRERVSPIAVDGTFRLADIPRELTVVMTADPYRPRHDARPSEYDTRLWVLLYKGQTLLLPALTVGQEQVLLNSVQQTTPEPLLDRSHTEIARLYTVQTPPAIFAPRAVIDYPLDATFNDEIRLKGYTLRDPDLTPGKVIFVTLYWQALAKPRDDYNLVAQIWNDGKESLASATDFPYGGAYRTRIWRTDELVATHHWLALPENLPVGRYTLAVAVTQLLGGKRLAVSGPNADPALQVALAPDLRYPRPTESINLPAPPQAVQFGDLFSISGLTINLNGSQQTPNSTWRAAPDQTLTLDLAWKTLKRPPHDYSVFAHISPARDVPPIAQADLTMGQMYPTGAWRPGDVIHDQLNLKLPSNLAPGQYNVLLGVYDWQTGERLPLMVDGKALPDAQWEIGILVVGR